ncbi:hypothetical protein KRP22_012846 [Phytophthora ramorum]|nr:putative casein kinase II subunit beta-4 [Phytophthora ramorum]
MGLSSTVPFYDYALDIVLDIETPNDSSLTQIQQEMIEPTAEMLYGLIHAQCLLTTKGMAAILDKYQTVDFGCCHHGYQRRLVHRRLQFEARDVNAAKFNFCMGKTATMLALIFAEARDYAADTNRLMHRHICWRSGRSRWASSSRAESSP